MVSFYLFIPLSMLAFYRNSSSPILLEDDHNQFSPFMFWEWTDTSVWSPFMTLFIPEFLVACFHTSPGWQRNNNPTCKYCVEWQSCTFDCLNSAIKRRKRTPKELEHSRTPFNLCWEVQRNSRSESLETLLIKTGFGKCMPWLWSEQFHSLVQEWLKEIL